MDRSEASKLLLAMADCLQTNPNQFNYTVNVNVDSITGLRVSANAPGSTGMSVVMGAGSGGTGVYVRAGIEKVDLEFANGIASQAERALIQEAASIIKSIGDDLDRDADRESIQGKLQRLAELSVPSVVSATVSTIIQLVFGA